jgi:nucleotide-binding universal stress UspA family protein
MHRRIVVPLDGSAFAEAALPPATSIARQTVAHLELVMVHQAQLTGASPMGAIEVDERIRDQETRYLAAEAQQIAADSGVPAMWAVLDGPVVTTLAGYARSRRAALVVMSTHGRGGVGRFFLGSTADRLIRALQCAMLLLRPAQQTAISELGLGPRILVPLDGSTRSEAILDQLSATFPGTTELELVRVAVPPITTPLPFAGASPIPPELVEQEYQLAEEYLQGVAARLRKKGFAVRAAAVTDLSPASAIAERARARRCDLIAIATRGVGGLERALLGSVADKVIRGADMPVLVWNPPDDLAAHVPDAKAAAAAPRGSRAVVS